jgi:hypothetical protein
MGDKISQLDSKSPNHQNLADGREISVFCQHEEYRGQWKEKWGISTGAVGLDPIDPHKAAEIDNLMGKVLRAKPEVERQQPKAEEGGASNPSPEPAAAIAFSGGKKNDDLPFWVRRA